MTDTKLPREASRPRSRDIVLDPDLGRRLDPETRELLEMAILLGPRDRLALSHIIRRAGEICESEGEETALAVLDQIHAILTGRLADA